MAQDQVDLERFERTVRSLDGDVPEEPDVEELRRTARALVADGKGILAADESNSTASKRLKAIGVDATPETRRTYRQLLFTAPGLGEHISGVILYDESIRQSTDDGTPFPRVLQDQGVIPGIKTDTGTAALAGHSGEKVTTGLDGQRDRLAEYRQIGARFAKWRAVIQIGDGLPSAACLGANGHAMARYAALCQEAGVVPIVEPEVLMDGDHSMARCEEVTAATLRALYEALAGQDVLLEGTLLKTNMVLPGTDSGEQPSPEEVAEATLRCMRRTVPAAVPGIVFLSGGQSAVDATVRLNAMNTNGPHPWSVSFSYARALQGPALDAWGGDEDRVEDAQRALIHRTRCNGAATTGTYKSEMEDELAAA
ncbi:MAG TPA: class I fructose-bisphosphate aldolase [Nitriliruptorales bacterium]|nr:class I fructose-bisphosphate aldolase [Nitriliruptorales bacterium]